ncbi:MAG: hypothetical protein IKT17_06380, partial [Lachnospiraceae bacterium]|nr:hypothetical protein [Lachnospiraceae bacterium]
DYLALGPEARINIPSTLGGNWVWRMDKNAFTKPLIKKIYFMTCLYSRCPEKAAEDAARKAAREKAKAEGKDIVKKTGAADKAKRTKKPATGKK